METVHSNQTDESKIQKEPKVIWPDPRKPTIIKRDFILVFITSSKESETKSMENVELEILVNNRLYLVREDHPPLRMGQVISRNLDLTKKKGGNKEDPKTHCFIRYDGVNEARRGMGQLNGTYVEIETIELQDWRMQLDWMLRKAWTLKKHPDSEHEYIWKALQLVSRFKYVENDHKKKAKERTKKAANQVDSLGRKNIGMIPLLCSSASDDLFHRIQEMRGIGRAMDWRAVVLEIYIDQLRQICLEIQRVCEYHLVKTFFQDAQYFPSVLKKISLEFNRYATLILNFRSRPFTRSFGWSSLDLQTTSDLLNQAIVSKDRNKVDEAISHIKRVYRAMKMLQHHAELEELLILVSRCVHKHRVLNNQEVSLCIDEITRLHQIFGKEDEFTHQFLEQDFRHRILPRVLESLHLAKLALFNQKRDSKTREYTKVVFDHLKEACIPF